MVQQAGNENDRPKTSCRRSAAGADNRRELKNTGKPQNDPVGKIDKGQEHVVQSANGKNRQKNSKADPSHACQHLCHMPGKQAFQYVTAIEGWDGQEIEPCQYQVRTDAAEQHLQSEVAYGRMENERIRGKKNEEAEADPQKHCQEKIAKWSCSRNQKHVTPVVPEIPGIDRDGLCPAEYKWCEKAGKDKAA